MVIKLSKKARTHLDSLTARQKELYYVSGVFAPDGDFSTEALLSVQKGAALSKDELDESSGDVVALAPNLINGEVPYFRHTSQNARKYALRELKKNDRSVALQENHMRYYRTRAQNGTPGDPIALESDCAQLRHAINWTANTPDADLTGLVLAAGHYLVGERDWRGEALQWVNLVLARADDLESGDDLRLMGDLSFELRYTDAAEEFYHRALHRYGEESLAGQAHTYKGLGDLSQQVSDLDAALQYYHRAYILYEVMGFALGQANTLRQMGRLRTQLGAPDEAHADYQRALAIYADLGFDFELANCYRAVADLHSAQGDFSDAQDNYERAYALYGQLGFEVEQAAVTLAMGDMHLHAERIDQADDHYVRALVLFREAGDRLGQAEAQRAIGSLRLKTGNQDAARAAFHDARERYAQVGADQEAVIMLQILATLHLDNGQQQEAAALIHQLLPVLDRLEDPLLVHEVQTRLRRVVRQIGDGFKALWSEVAVGEKVPGWLLVDEDEMPSALVEALSSEHDLHTALESDPLLLDHLSRVPIPRRAEWLEGALDLCEPQSTQARVRRHRAMLLKEIAALPGQNVNDRLMEAISEFDAALDLHSGDANEYALTQKHRVALLRDMAGMSGVNRAELLYRAKGGCDAALEKLQGQSVEYAHMQLVYAHLLREMAGLHGEDRAERMLQALAVFDEALSIIADTPLQHATAQSNRASLLQEIAGLPGEDEQQRLREALAAAADSVVIAAQAEEANYTPIAKRMLANIRQGIIETYDAKTFDVWWQDIVGLPQPEWILTA